MQIRVDCDLVTQRRLAGSMRSTENDDMSTMKGRIDGLRDGIPQFGDIFTMHRRDGGKS